MAISNTIAQDLENRRRITHISQSQPGDLVMYVTFSGVRKDAKRYCFTRVTRISAKRVYVGNNAFKRDTGEPVSVRQLLMRKIEPITDEAVTWYMDSLAKEAEEKREKDEFEAREDVQIVRSISHHFWDEAATLKLGVDKLRRIAEIVNE